MADATEVAQCAADKLKVDVSRTLPYAENAVQFVTSMVGTTLPDGDGMLDQGLCLLTMRLFQDSPTPGG